MTFKRVLFMLAACLILQSLFFTPTRATAQTPPPVPVRFSCEADARLQYERWVTGDICPFLTLDAENTLAAAPLSADLSQPSNAPDDQAEYTYAVFASYRDDNWEVYQSSYPWGTSGNQNPTRMTENPATDTMPALRPGSTDVVFASNRTGNFDLFLMNWSGVIAQQLTTHPAYDSQPSWSADGQKLAFVSDRDGNLEIYSMLADGTSLTRLSFDSADDFNPGWSPDGESLVWVKAVDDSHGVVYIMNADGSNPHAITQPLRFLQHPTWSLDGGLIALDYDTNQDGWNDLALMNADGSDLHGLLPYWGMTDFWAGPWTGLYRDEFLFTMIQYVVYQNQLYLLSAQIGGMNLVEGGVGPFSYSRWDFYPSAASIDLTLPESHILPLPRLVHAGSLPITISSYDPGPAAVNGVKIQLRDGLYGTWQNAGYVNGDPISTRDLVLPAGKTYYFRSQAYDDAGHIEAMPTGNGDAFTSIYTWQLTGKVIDIRERAVQQAVVQTEPAFADQVNADQDGNFHRYVPTESVTVNISKTGYANLPARVLSSPTDAQFTLMLPPQDEVIQNGGFEQGFTSWDLSSYLPPALDYMNVHSGNAAAGFSCTGGAGNAPGLVSSSLSQTVTLPADMHNPTLSFHYFQQDSYGGLLTVEMNGQVIFSSTQALSTWQYQWLDVSAWLGQTVEIKFTLQTGEDQVSVMSYLDDVSLGSWATPLISTITPNHAEAYTPLTLTITGDNFIDMPAVRLNEVALDGVERLDAATLVVHLPQGLAPDIYTVRVVNPGGQDSLILNGLKVGQFVYLPVAFK